MKLGIVLVVMSVWASGCSKEAPAGSGRPALGKERGDCKPDKVCDRGLICLSNVCVQPPPADCTAVAEGLASMDLGNYAEPEERAPVVATYRAACEKAHVTKEQGECFEKATDKVSAMMCAPFMFPKAPVSKTGGDCTKVIARIRQTMAQQFTQVTDPQTLQMMNKAMTAMQESCEQDGWPDALKTCILQAGDGTDAMSQCNTQMTPDVQQKMTDRMMKMMQQTTP